MGWMSGLCWQDAAPLSMWSRMGPLAQVAPWPMGCRTADSQLAPGCSYLEVRRQLSQAAPGFLALADYRLISSRYTKKLPTHGSTAGSSARFCFTCGVKQGGGPRPLPGNAGVQALWLPCGVAVRSSLPVGEARSRGCSKTPACGRDCCSSCTCKHLLYFSGRQLSGKRASFRSLAGSLSRQPQ